jgi:hypothetical protein
LWLLHEGTKVRRYKNDVETREITWAKSGSRKITNVSRLSSDITECLGAEQGRRRHSHE